MKIICLKCRKIKELTHEELQEVGEFVHKKRLRAVHFLKYLSMDLRDPCAEGSRNKEHVYEFEESFDKEIHDLAKEIKNSRNDDKKKKMLGTMKEIAFIPDEELWT